MSCYSSEPDPFPPPPSIPPLRIDAAARTDRGLERPDNEDRVLFGDAATGRAFEPPAATTLSVPPCAFFALVCDGMGGEAGGEIASGLAASGIAASLRAGWDATAGSLAHSPDESHLAQALVASIEAASARIRHVAREHPRLARMGTTATLAAVAERTLLVAQVGDSRAYVFRAGRLEQLTRDQTMAEMLRSNGAIPIDHDGDIIGAHVILQALGSSPRLDVVVTRTPIDQGDVVVLCSDGLHGAVEDGAIAAALSSHADLAAACDALVVLANDAGGPDNVSCVAFRVARSLSAGTADALT